MVVAEATAVEAAMVAATSVKCQIVDWLYAATIVTPIEKGSDGSQERQEESLLKKVS